MIMTLINNAPFDSEFFLYIEKSDDWGTDLQPILQGYIHEDDCTINDDDKSISVQPDTYDEYRCTCWY